MFQSSFKTLSAKAAALLDQELMSSGSFSIDQLMELAGLAVAKAVYHEYPSTGKNKVLVLVGPGNNGGDGLVAARHLKLWGKHEPIIYYPKKSTKNQLYANLLNQLKDLEIAEIESNEEVIEMLNVSPKDQNGVKVIIDSLFGFSFKPPIRDPFKDLIKYLSDSYGKIAPIVSVDIPSGWDVDQGPVDIDINATTLISLTAPKPCANHFAKPGKTHYLGGRFINGKIAQKYDLQDLLNLYKNDDLIVKL